MLATGGHGACPAGDPSCSHLTPTHGDPFSYEGGGTARVLYRSVDNELIEIAINAAGR